MMMLWRRRVLAAALSLAAAAGGALCVPGTAQAQQPVTTGTFSFSGTKGDYISQGKSYSYDTKKGDALDITGRGEHGLSISVTGYNGDWWTLLISAPGSPMDPGTYQAQRMGSAASLDLFGEGRGCNTSSSTFTITKAIITPSGYVQAFDVTFEQHCENGGDSLRGAVHIANPEASPEPTPTRTRPYVPPTGGAGATHAGGGPTLAGGAGTSPSSAALSEVARDQYTMIGFGVIAWAFFLVVGLITVGIVLLVRDRRRRRPVESPVIDTGGAL